MASSGYLLNSCILQTASAYYHIRIQKKSSKLTQEAKETGLKINIEKTKLLKVNSTQQAEVQLKGTDEVQRNRTTHSPVWEV